MGYGSLAFKAVVDWAKGKNLYLNSADGKEAMYARSGFTKFMWIDYQLVAAVKPQIEHSLDLTSIEPGLGNKLSVLSKEQTCFQKTGKQQKQTCHLLTSKRGKRKRINKSKSVSFLTFMS